MVQYTFENLDDYSFEILCRDLLNEEQRQEVKENHGLGGNFNLSFTTFKRGKDRGIDLYYSAGEITVVGQVKHVRSDFKGLMKALRQKLNGKTEADKVKALGPSKYIFMTSVALSISNKEELQRFFSPFVIRISDIYGREDLNKLLSLYSHVERRHVQLYFTNHLVLENLMTAANVSSSMITVEQIKDQVKSFVQTTNFSTALKAIDSRNLLIIKGLPGVGKTVLAELLCLYYVEKGYKFIEVLNIDTEIERLLERPEKCIFYYNDFLGANTLLVADALRNEARLSRLLRRIESSSSKKIVLTTRNNLLNNAEINSEGLGRIFERISPYELDISGLSYEERYEMLRVHIEKNNIPIRLFANDLFDFICEHKNFSPRLIEFISNRKDVDIHIESYEEFVKYSFENPKKIWEFAYQNQTSHICKIYLNHLFLFGSGFNTQAFRASFEKRIQYEVLFNNYSSDNQEFKSCTRQLDTTFITIKFRYNFEEAYQDIEFINPSFADYIRNEIRENRGFILGSVLNFDRHEILLERFNHTKKDLIHLMNSDMLRSLLLNKNSLQIFREQYSVINYLELISNYFDILEIENVFAEDITSIFYSDEMGDSVYDYLNFLNEFSTSMIVNKFVTNHHDTLFPELFDKIVFKSDFDSIMDVMKLYKIDIKEYIGNERVMTVLKNSFYRVLNDDIGDYVFMKKEYIKSRRDIDDIYSDLITKYLEYLELFSIEESLIIGILDGIDWQGILNFHQFKNSGII
jgi:DNA polymerase III delta prime subunit